MKTNIKQWIAAGLFALLVGEAALQTPPAAALAAAGRENAHRYWVKGRQYVRQWGTRHSWRGWRISRRKRRVVSRSHRKRPVPSVGRAASIIEPPPVRVAVSVPMTATGRVSRAVPTPRSIPFPVSGPPVSGVVLDGMDRGRRVSLVTDDGRFITVQLNGATRVLGAGHTASGASVREGMRVFCRGGFQRGDADSYDAAHIAVQGQMNEQAVQQRVTEACRKLARTRPATPAPEPTPTPEAKPTPEPTPAAQSSDAVKSDATQPNGAGSPVLPALPEALPAVPSGT